MQDFYTFFHKKRFFFAIVDFFQKTANSRNERNERNRKTANEESEKANTTRFRYLLDKEQHPIGFFSGNAKRNDYSSSFLAAFLVAFFAGFSSASIEAFSSARAERSPRVVFSTFGISTCGSSGLAAFLAALAGASLRSSHVRRCETRIRLASRLKI